VIKKGGVEGGREGGRVNKKSYLERPEETADSCVLPLVANDVEELREGGREGGKEGGEG